MFKFNVEMKKHCRNFRKINMGCGCHLSQNVDLNTHVQVLLTLYLFNHMKDSHTIFSRILSMQCREESEGSYFNMNSCMKTLIVVKVNFGCQQIKQKYQWQLMVQTAICSIVVEHGHFTSDLSFYFCRNCIELFCKRATPPFIYQVSSSV